MWSVFSLVTLSCGLALGQQTLPPPPSDVGDAPPEPSIIFGDDDDGSSVMIETESIDTGQVLEPMPSIFDDSGHAGGQFDYWNGMPAVTESTGSWLQRGFWYTEVDAMMLNRFWNRSGVILAAENNSSGIFTDKRALAMRGAHPGYDGGIRFTLGHFLFRDADNRDHTAEFTVASSGEFTAEGTITSSNGNALIVPFQIDGNVTGGPFDQADAMQFTYASRYNSFEGNYRVKRRMRKDQMVLEPTGEWVRRASPTWTKEFLAGLRFFDLTERFNWNAQDLALAAGEDGEYFIRTDNNLFGMQIGGGHAYQTGRWSIALLSKAGVYLNDAKGRQRLIIDNDPNGDNFITKQSEEQISFLGEVRLTSRVHITPNWSVRAGYEMLYVTSTALAAHQAHFIPVFSQLGTSGDPFYHGFSAGFEGYW
jgi:hypothetical protein